MLTSEDRQAIYHFLNVRFNLEELKSLTFELGIDYESFPHETKPTFCRELIAYCERLGQVPCLPVQALKERPDETMYSLVAKLPSCQPRKKVQIIISDNALHSKQNLLRQLANMLGIAPEEIAIIGAAAGSIKLLIALPADAAEQLLKSHSATTLAAGETQARISLQLKIADIAPLEELPRTEQQQWRAIHLANQAHCGGRLSVGNKGRAKALRVHGDSLVVARLSATTKWLLAALILALSGGSTGGLVWAAAPRLTVQNACLIRLPPSGELPIIGHVEPGSQAGSFLVPPGRYRLDMSGNDPTLKAPLIGEVALPGGGPYLSLARLDVNEATIAGSQQPMPTEFDVNWFDQAKITLCAP